jgi:2-succinyl-5-enolpyruvyl-6-hydroxy-3-cyclohexene-1-carboxylate synthase
MNPGGPWPNPSTALGTTIVDELVRNGVEDVVLAPGSRSAALAMAAADSPLRLWVEIDERAAGFFALGIVRGSGHADTVAAVITTSGTAVANLFPAVIEADEGAIPLLLLTADRPPELRGAGANQAIDQVKIFGDKVRWFADISPPTDTAGEAEVWRSTICRALAYARGLRGAGSGPVHLNIGFREPLVPATDDGRTLATPYVSPTAGRADGAPFTVVARRAAVEPSVIAVDGRTLVVAGSGASLESVESALAAGCVVIAEGHSGCRIPGTISTAHHLLASPAFHRLGRPDRAVVLGRAGLSRNLAALLDRLDLIVVSATGWPDPSRRAIEMHSALRFRGGAVDRDWVELWSRAEKVARDSIDRQLDARAEPTEPRVARDVAAAVPPDGVLAVASSMPVRDLDWFAASGEGVPVVANRGASGIDGFISLALGAASRRRVVALAGDLSVLHDQSGLAVRPRPDAVFVVVNNGGGGIFSFLPQAQFPDHFEQLFATPSGIDFADLAAMHDLEYAHITTAPRLTEAIAAAMAQGGVHLLEVRTDREANVRLHRDLTEAVVEALDSLIER